MVLASQCILQTKPKSMRITIDGELNPGVTAKDIILYIINKMSTGGATGYFIEYSGTTIESLSMEGRMTICNMSIEMGARGGMIAPDDKTFEYLKGREYAPKGEEWDNSISYWRTLRSENDAVFDREIKFSASDITPRITYGTNPGMNIDINGTIPLIDDIKADDKESFLYSLKYMGFQQGEQLIGHDIDYVFMGSCTNGRIEDFRAFANAVKDHHKADNVTAWLVPGSNMVAEQIRKEKLDKILSKAGFEIRQPGCSACLAMNGDKIPKDKYVVSTSNRNFIGRQGPGSRTILASPIVAAVAAITGKITNPNEILNS
jgi:3-isopropylmalate/(R)-2-methylmalate dehydratase large subunit